MSRKQKKQVKKEETAKMKTQDKTERRVFSAQEKVEAVLSVWSERRKPREVCKEMQISWTMLSQWQDVALSAMLVALEPRVRKEEERGPALGPKLEKLLQKKLRQKQAGLSKVEQRLIKIQEAKQKAM